MTVHDTEDNFTDAQPWDLPNVGEVEENEEYTNALNRPKSKWKYEAPEEELEVNPLTAEEIEAIRESAYQEGFKLGQEEGFEKAYQEGLEAGREKGHELGLTQGKQQGLDEGKVLVEEEKSKFERLVSALYQPLSKIDSELKKELILLSQVLAQAIVNVETKQNKEILLAALEKGMAALPIQDNTYQISLNPEELEWLTQHFGEQTIAQNKWQLTASNTQEKGGCTIVTQHNAVDMSIKKRCLHVFENLLFEQGLSDDPRAKQ